jgi:flagellar motor protein MotB
MYAVSTVNSSKFQEMAESFSAAFMGRTTDIRDTGFGAANKGPFTFMPNPVELPIITREIMVRNAPPALRQEETQGDPTKPNEHGQFLSRGGVETQSQSQSQSQAPSQGESPQAQLQDTPASSMRDAVAQRVQNLDAAYAELSKSLSALIRKGEVNVTLQPLGVVIDINEVLLFHSGKADLTPDALPLIDEIAKILANLRYQIQVNGFTDNVPIHNVQFDSNWDLSATRAISVVKRFVAAGIDPTLLVGAGFSEYHPVTANNTTESKAANRRVSIVVVSPIEGTDPARSRLFGSHAERAVPAATSSATASSPPSGSPTGAASPAALQNPVVPPVSLAPITMPAGATPPVSPTATAVEGSAVSPPTSDLTTPTPSAATSTR